MTTQDALISALSQDWPVTGRESDQDLARDLLEAYGSQAAMARALRVPPTRVRSWLRGGEASEVDRLRLLAAVRVLRLPEDLDDTKITLNGTDHHGKPVKVTSKQLKIRPGTMDNIVDAYVAGDYPGAVDALINGIGEREWYREAFATGVWVERHGRRPAPRKRGGRS